MNERKLFGKISGEAFLATERVKIRNAENFDAARKHLEIGSVIVYFNHFARFDTIIYGKTIRDNLTSLDNVGSWVAMKYVDPLRNKLFSTLLHSWEEAYGITLFPIVQPADKDKYEHAGNISRRSFIEALEYLREPGRVLGVAPEGTRSNTGQLLKAERGFGSLLRKSEYSIALPLAGVHSRAIPLVSNTTVVVGESFSYEEIEREQKQHPDKTIADLAMMRIARLLPEANRGYYK